MPKEPQEIPVELDQQELWVPKELKEQQALRVREVPKETPEPKAHRVLRVRLEESDLRVP